MTHGNGQIDSQAFQGLSNGKGLKRGVALELVLMQAFLGTVEAKTVGSALVALCYSPQPIKVLEELAVFRTGGQ